MYQMDNKVYAEKGKELVLRADGFRFGKEVSLGKIYYINGELLSTPRDLTMADLKEVDEEETIM